MASHWHGFSWSSLATLPYHPSLHPVSVQSCCREISVNHPTLAHPCEGVHWSISLMSSPLLLLQCPACLVHWTWMVFKMGGRCPYTCCFVGCCLQDLFNTACSILAQLLSSFLFICLVSVHVVHPYNSFDMTAASHGQVHWPWKQNLI